MPSSGLAIISGPPDSSSETVIRQWLVRFAEHCRQKGRAAEITTALVKSWVDVLGHVDPKLLDAACRKTALTCKFFPTPADVYERIDQTNTKAAELEAEAAWQRTLKFAVNPGFSGLKELDARSQHAARAAGGLSWIESCPATELPWAQKRFIESYLRIEELHLAENLLTDGEAKKLVREVIQHAKDPQALPAAGPPEVDDDL